MDGNNNLPILPEGWMWTRLGDICLDPQYGWTTSATAMGSLRLVRTTDITPGNLDWDSVPFCKEEPPEKHKYLLKDGDIVISRAGSVGYSHLVKTPKEAVFASYLIRFRPLTDKAYLAHFLKSPSYWESISEKSLGIAIPNVNASKLKQVTVPLPPIPEQHRIVAKIEELFTRLDAGLEALNRIKLQLRQYRQAVLKHAFEGKLTEEWREAHKAEMEPASVLLERIREERRKNINSKYKELPSLDTSELPELPEGWAYLILDYLASSDRNSIKRGPFGSSIKKAFFMPYGYKVYEQGNVIYNDFERGNYFIDDKKFNELKGFEVKAGDILMSCSGTVGKIAIVPEGIKPGVINQALLKISLDNKVIDTLYFTYLFRSRIDEIMLKNTRGSAMVNISSAKDLRQIPLPVPSLAEQYCIVSEIERHFSLADEVEKVIEQSLMRGERLRQSILKRAFEGKLVHQNPSDEPAEKLLERIGAEKAAREVEKKAMGKSRNKFNKTQGRLM